jgi:hypothetical protein
VKKLYEKQQSENGSSPSKLINQQQDQQSQLVQSQQQRIITSQQNISTQQQQQQPRLTPQKPTPQQQQQQNSTSFIEKATQQYQQQLQQQKQQQLQPQQKQSSKRNSGSMDDSSLEPDLKEKIMYVIQIFNQTNTGEFTFEVNNYLNSIDSQARKLYGKEMIGQIYTYLAASFKIDKDVFMNKINSIRLDFHEKQLKNLLKKFQVELNKEMKVLEEKHNHAYSDFVKKLNELQQQQQLNNEEIKKKIFGPRKKFVWSNELKDIFKNILTNFMNLFEMKDIKGADKLGYLREYLNKELLVFWPEGWMQLNVLVNEAEVLLGFKAPALKKQSLSPQNHQQTNSQNTIGNRITSGASNNDEKPVKINNFVDNSVIQLKSSQSSIQQQPRKVVASRVPNTTSNQQLPQQQQQQQKQNQTMNPSPQRPSISNTQTQQRTFQNTSPSQSSKSNSSHVLSGGPYQGLTSSQQKLLANAANATSINNYLSSILATANLKPENIFEQQQLKNLYSNSNDLISKSATVNSHIISNIQKTWSEKCRLF